MRIAARTVVHGAEDAGKATEKGADKAGIASLEGGMGRTSSTAARASPRR
jgi:hypothetical protein